MENVGIQKDLTSTSRCSWWCGDSCAAASAATRTVTATCWGSIGKSSMVNAEEESYVIRMTVYTFSYIGICMYKGS